MQSIQSQTSNSDPTPKSSGSASVPDPSTKREDRPRFVFPVPRLETGTTCADYTRHWDRPHHPAPLIPLRRIQAAERSVAIPPPQTGWEPVQGWWEEPASAAEVKKLLLANSDLGLGLRLGGIGPETLRLIDVLVKDRKEAASALSRIFGPKGLGTAHWLDGEGTHFVFLGYQDLARFGQVVVGAWKGNGGNPHYPGLGDPAGLRRSSDLACRDTADALGKRKAAQVEGFGLLRPCRRSTRGRPQTVHPGDERRCR